MDEMKIKEKIEFNQQKLEKIFSLIEKCNQRIEKWKNVSEKEYGITVPDDEDWQKKIETEAREKFDDEHRFQYVIRVSCTIEDLQDQIKNNLRKVKEIETRIEGFQKKIENVSMFKLEYKSLPQVIKDFLENWKTEAVKFHIEHRKENKDFENLTDEQIERVVEEEKIFKGLDISRRVFRKCGKITNSGELYIGKNGGINGLIIGEKGRANVETIMAGGYNIQCLHFRVLVK